MASGGVWKGDKLTQLTVSWAEMSPGLGLAPWFQWIGGRA